MRQSELFTKTSKTVSKDEVSLNAQLLLRAGFVDRLTAGVYTLLPLGFKVFKKIEKIIREEINAIGGQEIWMSALCPKDNYVKTGRYKVLLEDILFQAESKHVKEMVLGMSHEEVVVPVMKKFVSSYKDLPKAVYHIQDKFRGEARPKSGILRGREFFMKDLYSFHTDEKDLGRYYDEVRDAYFKIFTRAGIREKTFLTYASGGTFSKYSHEFQTLTSAGEDSIYICDKCNVAVNQEIIEDQDHKCPECGNAELREEKAVEVGNIFKLGTKFSEPFDLSYLDNNGEKNLVIMGCYGIGLQRLMGTIVELFNDKDGIIWPETVAPFDAHLILLESKDQAENEKVKKAAEELYAKLTQKGKEVLFDDRAGKKPGEKFADADLIGIPLRIVISAKTLAKNKIEIKKRNEKESQLVEAETLLKS